MPFGPNGGYYEEHCQCESCHNTRSGASYQSTGHDGEARREINNRSQPASPVPGCTCDQCTRIDPTPEEPPVDPYAERAARVQAARGVLYRSLVSAREQDAITSVLTLPEASEENQTQALEEIRANLDASSTAVADGLMALWRLVKQEYETEFADTPLRDRPLVTLTGDYERTEDAASGDAYAYYLVIGDNGCFAIAQIDRRVLPPVWAECANCGEASHYTGYNTLTYIGRRSCLFCTIRCSECGDRCEDDGYGDDLCSGCRPMAHCNSCDRGIYADDDYGYDEDYGEYYCYSCDETRSGGDHPGESGVEQPEEQDLSAVSLLMDDMGGERTVRKVGLEIEGGGSKAGLAAHLHSVGASPWGSPVGYHFQSRDRGVPERGWSVEDDATVDWEAVSPVLDLTVQEDADLAAAGIRGIASYVDTEMAWHDYRAGLHIHVGVEHLAITASYRIGRLWNYLEDVMFRLSSAKWGAHRTIMEGNDYCHPVPKEIKSQMEFQRVIQRAGRYSALSFQNYLDAHLSNCQCGNCRFGSWETCVCESLGKCTFEFRVFNATSNVLKVKAYVALCQAIVSYGERMEPLTDDEWSAQFPDLPFHGGNRRTDEGAQERLSFILNELPMTADEKEAVLYCIRNSDLNALGDEVIDNLINQEVTA